MEKIKIDAQAVYDKILELLRKELALAVAAKTQEEIADLCGVSQPTINRFLKAERGKDLPFKTIIKVVLALDLDLSSLLSPEPKSDKEKVKTLLDQLSKLIA